MRQKYFICFFNVFLIGILFTPVNIATIFAAEISIDSTVGTGITSHQKSSNNIVCISDTDCYVFYINSDSDVEYQKDTNSGTTWGGTSTQIHSGTFLGIAVWYDRWTPGDSGNLIHFVYYSSADDLTYGVMDTADNDSVTSNVVIASAGAQGSLTATNDLAITKGIDGDLYVVTVDDTGPTAPANFTHKCTGTCTSAGNWVSAGSNPWDGAGDDTDGSHDVVLLPLSDTASHDTGDIMLVSLDVTDGTAEYKVYDDSGDSWSTNFTDIESVTDSTTYRHSLSGAVDPTTGELYISFAHLPGTANTSEVRAWNYNDSWTQLTDPWPNSTDGASIIIDTAIGVDENTGDLYVTYIRADSTATANDVYYAISQDDGSSWTSDNLISDGTDRDHRNVYINSSSDERLYGGWIGPPTTATTLYGDTVANLSAGSPPGTPGTPYISSAGVSTLRVNWTGASGATSYKVERCSGGGCSGFSQIASGVTNDYYDDSGLTPGTIYRYRIRGTNGDGDGSYSGTGEGTTFSNESSSSEYSTQFMSGFIKLFNGTLINSSTN